MRIFCVFTFILEAFTMLSLRGHYTIDIIAGAIIAHYIWENVNKYIYFIDVLTFNKQEESKINNLSKIENENKYSQGKINEDNGDIFIPVRVSNSNVY